MSLKPEGVPARGWEIRGAPNGLLCLQEPEDKHTQTNMKPNHTLEAASPLAVTRAPCGSGQTGEQFNAEHVSRTHHTGATPIRSTDLQASTEVRLAQDVQKSEDIKNNRERIYDQHTRSRRTSKMLGRNSWEDDVLYYYYYTNSFQIMAAFNLKSQQKLKGTKLVTAMNQEKIPGKSSTRLMPLSEH